MTIPERDEPIRVCGNRGEILDADIEKVKEYIVLNKAVLLDIWYQRVDQMVLSTLERFQNLPESKSNATSEK
jgi:hypothetical protein